MQLDFQLLQKAIEAFFTLQNAANIVWARRTMKDGIGVSADTAD
jgi:hypothetical protein